MADGAEELGWEAVALAGVGDGVEEGVEDEDEEDEEDGRGVGVVTPPVLVAVIKTVAK